LSHRDATSSPPSEWVALLLDLENLLLQIRLSGEPRTAAESRVVRLLLGVQDR
jgi:hypothetical protein